MMDNTRETTLPIVEMARNNSEYRKIVWTGEQSQVVLMAIEEGGEIGGEVHEGHDQLLWFVEGEGLAQIGDDETPVKAGRSEERRVGNEGGGGRVGSAQCRA